MLPESIWLSHAPMGTQKLLRGKRSAPSPSPPPTCSPHSPMGLAAWQLRCDNSKPQHESRRDTAGGTNRLTNGFGCLDVQAHTLHLPQHQLRGVEAGGGDEPAIRGVVGAAAAGNIEQHAAGARPPAWVVRQGGAAAAHAAAAAPSSSSMQCMFCPRLQVVPHWQTRSFAAGQPLTGAAAPPCPWPLPGCRRCGGQ